MNQLLMKPFKLLKDGFQFICDYYYMIQIIVEAYATL